MQNAQKVPLRTLLMVEHSRILHEARKGVKALRLQHLQSIMLIGDNLGAITCVQATKHTGLKQSAQFNRFNRVISAGFITKRNKVYYLTDSGQSVYNTICREFDTSLKKIVDILADEVRRKV